jgi:hypothetical protein
MSPLPTKIGTVPAALKQPSKIGLNPDGTYTDPNQATQAPITVADTNSDSYTYFTQVATGNLPQTQLLYTADRAWVKLTLVLETAGPVAVGTKSTLTPVLGGAGILLPPPSTGGNMTPLTWTLAKGNKFYIASTSVNRVKVVIDPYPWLQDIVRVAAAILQTLLPKK